MVMIRRERSVKQKTQQKQMVQHVWVLHSLTDAQPVPERRLVAHRQLLPVYGWSVTFCGMEYPFAHFGHIWLQPKYQFINNIIFIISKAL